MNIAEIRKKYPQYDHVADQQLVDALHSKYYSHVPKQDFYERIGFSPEPEQGFLNKLPRNIAAGLSKGATGLANIPYDIGKGIAGIHNAFSPQKSDEEQFINQAAGGNQPDTNPERIPHFKERDYSKMFGIKGEPTAADEAIQFASEFAAPLGAGAKSVAKGATKLAQIMADLPLTKQMASQALKKADALAVNRGVSGIQVDKDILKDIKQFLPNTTPYKKLMDAAKKGNYQSLFTLQSDLGKSGRQLIKSASGAERIHGIEAHKARERLIGSMVEKLKESGHHDIAELMKHGQNRYRQYHKLVEKVYKPGLKAAKYAGVPVGIGSIMGALIKASKD